MNTVTDDLRPDNTSFTTRRERLIQRMQAAGGGVAVLATAPERTRNRDTHYPYRYDSYFHYLTGFGEPEAIVVLIAGDAPKSLLFCREKNEEREIWDGRRWGPQAAREAFGFDEAHPIDAFDTTLPELLIDQPLLWCGFGHDEAWDARIIRALNAVRARTRAGITAPHSLRDALAELDEMRLIKDASELAIMRRAGELSAAAHCRAMRATRPNRFEYEIEAELLHAFRSAGSQGPAYPSIVASGPNACILHYIENHSRMGDGDLLLIDAGCELDGYASDITRTFPVNGRFSGPQRDVYQLVLEAQHAARAETRPGQHWNAPHEAAVKVLAQGMLDLGLLQGDIGSVLESGDYRRFYMHRTGHWLGRDVHDAGEYKKNGEWRTLAPGMVMTIEPGCYIRPADNVPEAFWNIGVRIEDNAVITANGCEYLTEGVPREIDDIEALMRDTNHDGR